MILTFDKVGWFFDILRNFFISIDGFVYSLVGLVMQGIFNISSLTLDSTLAKTIYDRIYVLLTLFMVFKLTMSFLQYMISPDTMMDKERGVGKLISRIVITICMIVLLPILFFDPIVKIGDSKEMTILDALQVGVIKTLPKIILGLDGEEVENVDAASEKNGQIMAIQMFKAFYYPAACNVNSEVYNETECAGTTDSINTLDDIGYNITEPSKINSNYYQYQYMWPLTTIAGIALVVILFGFALDVAVRVFKMLILQVIAPIPVMSYIDPKASKDGAFSSWLKNFTSTYIEIFIKLGTVYVLLLLFSKILKPSELFGDSFTDDLTGSAQNVVRIFLMIGVFKFAKDAPKFLKDALGIKDSGKSGGLFGGLATLGAAAGTIGGAAAGAIGGVAGGIAAAKAAGQGKAMGALKGLGGGLAGLGRGGIQGAKGAGKGNVIKGMSGAFDAQNAVTQRKIAAAAGGSTLAGRLQAQTQKFFTGQTAADVDKENIDNYKEAIDDVKNFKNVLADSASKSDAILSVGGRNVNLKQFKGTLAAAQSGNRRALQTLGMTYGFASLSDAIAGQAKFEKDFQKAYYTAVETRTITDPDADAVLSAKSVVDAGLTNLNLTDSSGRVITAVTAQNAGEIIGSATAATNVIKSSRSYKANKANADAIKKGK